MYSYLNKSLIESGNKEYLNTQPIIHQISQDNRDSKKNDAQEKKLKENTISRNLYLIYPCLSPIKMIEAK